MSSPSPHRSVAGLLPLPEEHDHLNIPERALLTEMLEQVLRLIFGKRRTGVDLLSEKRSAVLWLRGHQATPEPFFSRCFSSTQKINGPNAFLTSGQASEETRPMSSSTKSLKYTRLLIPRALDNNSKAPMMSASTWIIVGAQYRVTRFLIGIKIAGRPCGPPALS